MPVVLELIDLDAEFMASDEDKIIVNELGVESKEDLELVESLVLSTYDQNEIDFVAACSCGHLRGNYLIEQECEYCSTKVKNPFKLQDPVLWIKALDPELPFINPSLWSVMRDVLVKNHMDVLSWITNSRVRDPIRRLDILEQIPKRIEGFERDYKWFIDNFPNNVLEILSLPKYASGSRDKVEDFKALLAETGPKQWFTHYLPIPNKKLLVVEKTSKARYMDYNIGLVRDAVNAAAMAKVTAKSPKALRNKTAAIVSSLAMYYNQYQGKFWRKKTSILRRHLLSTRSYFSFRCVITEIDGPHNYDELHIPWGVGMTAFRPHLMNVLVKQRGYTLEEASSKLLQAVQHYDHELYEIFMGLVNSSNFVSDAGTRGFACLICRNPTMKQGSIQRVVVCKIKTDVRDNSMSFGIAIAKSKNADFDGDEENVLLALDKRMSDLMRPLAPHHNVVGDKSVLGVSGYLFLPKPVIATMANWLDKGDIDRTMTEKEIQALVEGSNVPG